MKKLFLPSILFFFIMRLAYGLTGEFWFGDQLQVYLIGLKYYTTGLWPYFGTDIVYTQSQIPGALLGLLTGTPFKVAPIAEAPTIFINILTFSSLAYMAWYLTKRLPALPWWFTWVFLMTSPWTLFDGTVVINLSYVLFFSCFFFVSFWENSGFYSDYIVSRELSFLLMGLAISCIFQLHMSWVLLLPFTGYVFYYQIRSKEKRIIAYISFFTAGFLIGISLVLPTILHYGINSTGGAEKNIVFKLSNFKNFFTVLARYFSLASFEVPYMLGPNTQARLDVVKSHIWMAPFTVLLLVAGFLQVLYYLFMLVKKSEKNNEWKKVRIFTLVSFLLIFFSFFFSIKGPSSHTFYIMLPASMFFALYSYSLLYEKTNSISESIKKEKRKKLLTSFSIIYFLSGFIFHTGLMMDNFKARSLYKNRERIQKAIDEKDYHILGTRRSEKWGHGY